MEAIILYGKTIGHNLRVIEIIVTTVFTFIACGRTNDEPAFQTDLEKPTATIAVTFANAPVIDGSDSTTPLRNLLMCKLLNIDYSWMQHLATDATWDIFPHWQSLTNSEKKRLHEILKHRNTHGSFVDLIDGEDDLILTARGISRDEKKYAQSKGVTLLERPIAKDALVFIVNPKNKVRRLTIEQIRHIYTGEIRNWREVGGADAAINPYVRNPNSGSQEKMETLVMKGLTMPDWPEMVIHTMLSPYEYVGKDVNGICYTPYYYYRTIVNNGQTSLVAVNGVMPNGKAIEDDSYPYVTDVVAAVRSDIDKASTAYQIFYQLCTGKFNDIIRESKYIVYK